MHSVSDDVHHLLDTSRSLGISLTEAVLPHWMSSLESWTKESDDSIITTAREIGALVRNASTYLTIDTVNSTPSPLH